MAKILVAAPPVTGELSPLLRIAEGLSLRGHQITVITGSRFRTDVEAAGLGFMPVSGLADLGPLTSPTSVDNTARPGPRIAW